ncbi:MAG: hypothetical protein EZS28_036562 [Streblomastix strix]|uniref:Uncharacterized protein n=1 Tax=Streblomastix strix TaxID=222440 RepID=A0A5J4UCL6_9EUKA|nr:MAG: hypothetical protein EZS28_036562 [Streblomastix strix]
MKTGAPVTVCTGGKAYSRLLRRILNYLNYCLSISRCGLSAQSSLFYPFMNLHLKLLFFSFCLSTSLTNHFYRFDLSHVYDYGHDHDHDHGDGGGYHLHLIPFVQYLGIGLYLPLSRMIFIR